MEIQEVPPAAGGPTAPVALKGAVLSTTPGEVNTGGREAAEERDSRELSSLVITKIFDLQTTASRRSREGAFYCVTVDSPLLLTH